MRDKHEQTRVIHLSRSEQDCWATRAKSYDLRHLRGCAEGCTLPT